MDWPHLHHLPGGSSTAGLQGFIDSPFGTALATAMHTVGAMAFFAGIFLSWRWIRRGGPGLATARTVTLVGIGLNGLGGLMRLYESDHPTLSQFGESAWVQAMLVKHVFLVMGMLGAFVLAQRAPRFDPVRPAASVVAAIALVSGLAAGALGAYASITPIPAQTAEAGMDADDHAAMDAPDHAAMGRAAVWRNFTGTITGTPIMPGTSTFPVDVPEGAAVLQADLSWSTPAAFLSIDAQGPEGTRAEGAASGGTGAQLTVEQPASGAWTLTVAAERAANEAFSVAVRISGAANSTWERTFMVPPSPGFAEVNFDMPAGAVIVFGFEVREAGQSVYYNVHSHPDDEVVIHEEGTEHELDSSFTAEEAEIYSVLWENRGAVPLTVHAWITGRFTLDSTFGT